MVVIVKLSHQFCVRKLHIAEKKTNIVKFSPSFDEIQIHRNYNYNGTYGSASMDFNLAT